MTTNSSSVALLTVLVFVAFWGTQCSIYCRNAYECASSEITLSDGGYVTCDGENSCRGSSITVIAYDIDCLGSYSCYNASKLETVYNESSDSNQARFECSGLYSCSNVDLIKTNAIYNFADASCSGELSCSNSQMKFNSTKAQAGCYGTKSCMNSKIENIQNAVSLYGYLSGYNGIFYGINDSYYSDGVSFRFRGAMSGKNATVICQDNAKCEISCDGNGCNEINSIKCESGNDNNCSIVMDCDWAEISDFCPNGYNLETVYNYLDISIPDLLDIEPSTAENSINLYHNNNSVNCDSYYGCRDDTFDFRNNNNNNNNNDIALCFTGTRGGYDAFIELNYNDSINNTIIRCDSDWACSGLTITIYYDSDTLINGNVIKYIDFYASGDASALSTTIQGVLTSGNKSDISNHENILVLFNLYCYGYIGCWQTSVKYDSYDNSMIIANNIYCMGRQACWQINIEIANNVYGYGADAAYKGNFANVKDSIYCVAYGSCESTTITNVTNNIYAIAPFSLCGATVSTVTNVYCISPYSCCESTFTDVSYLYAYGDNALRDSSIDCGQATYGRIICLSEAACNGANFTHSCNVTYIDIDGDSSISTTEDTSSNDDDSVLPLKGQTFSIFIQIFLGFLVIGAMC